jgi:hypothetical protein
VRWKLGAVVNGCRVLCVAPFPLYANEYNKQFAICQYMKTKDFENCYKCAKCGLRARPIARLAVPTQTDSPRFANIHPNYVDSITGCRGSDSPKKTGRSNARPVCSGASPPSGMLPPLHHAVCCLVSHLVQGPIILM